MAQPQTALRQTLNEPEYEYGRPGLLGAFAPVRREIISPAQSLPMGYTSTRRGVGVKQDQIPAQYGEAEVDPTYAPAYRGLKSALHALYDFGQDPMGTIKGMVQSAPEVAKGIDQYMRDQYTAGALGGTAYNPETGQVTEFDPTIAMVGGAPAGVQAVRAATPGSVVLGMIGSKNAKFAPSELEAINKLDKAGWDTSQLFLHGTASDFEGQMKPSRFGDLGPGNYLTGSVFDESGDFNQFSFKDTLTTAPEMAGQYAVSRKYSNPDQRVNGAPNTRPMIIKKGLKFYDVTGGMGNDVLVGIPEQVKALKQQGFDGIRSIDPKTGNVIQMNVFDPENIRSAFDYSIPETTLRSGSKQGTGVALASALSGNFDPRYAVGVHGGEPRKTVLAGLNPNARIVSGQQVDVPEFSLVDFEGRPFITHFSDRTDAGTVLQGINGVNFNNPLPLQGGQDFMFLNGELVWAGGGGHPTSYLRKAQELRDMYGENPLWLPWRMAPKGSDFSAMTGEAMIEFAANNMRPGEKRSLNARMKKAVPGWTNVDDPKMRDLWTTTDTKTRKAGLQIMDSFRDKGGISISDARLAIADPRQIDAPEWGLQNIGIIDPTRGISASAHRTYPKGIPGEGLGRLKENVSVLDLVAEQLRRRGQEYISDTPGGVTPEANSLLQFNALGGIIDEELLRSLGY